MNGAVTDLTWSQINDALKQVLKTNADLVTVDSNGNPTSVNIGAITGGSSNNFSVIKFMNVIHDAGIIAQASANTGKPAGERLNSFSNPVNAAPVNNFVQTTRTIVSRVDLRSATSIVGTNV